MDQCNSASDLAKQVNVLDAILWLKAAWDSVSASTITKCFVNCGFTGGDILGSEEEGGDEDIFLNHEVCLSNQLPLYILRQCQGTNKVHPAANSSKALSTTDSC